MQEQNRSDGCLAAFTRGELKVRVYETAVQAGAAAGALAADMLRTALRSKGKTSAVFASAVSQNHFLAALRTAPDLDWRSITGFHLDEYAGMREDHPASFRRYLREHLLEHVPLATFHGLRSESNDLEAECRRYAALLEAAKPALVALGIGENGHLAFIDPPVCDFRDPATVRVVELDQVCRQQQVNDGAFESIQDVPRQALSLTIPFFLSVPAALVTVTGPRKRAAVTQALDGPIVEACPASALREHRGATLFCDIAAYDPS